MTEFNKIRSDLYKEALDEFPEARAEDILGIQKIGKSYLLNWPMKVIITEKLK